MRLFPGMAEVSGMEADVRKFICIFLTIQPMSPGSLSKHKYSLLQREFKFYTLVSFLDCYSGPDQEAIKEMYYAGISENLEARIWREI